MQIMGTPERLCITLAICIFGVSFTVGQNTIFNFLASVDPGSQILSDEMYGGLQVPNSISEITQVEASDFVCFGDFNASSSYLSFRNNWGQMNVTGGCLKRNQVQLFEPRCRNLVSSFSTMFDVSWFHRSLDTIFQSLAFIITGDNITESEAGGYLGWLNSTNNNSQKSGHNFAVEFNIYYNPLPHPLPDFSDRDKVYLNINVNGRVINQTIIGRFNTSTDELGVWIDYDGGTQILDMTVGPSVWLKKPQSHVLSTKVDLTKVFQESMFVGFLRWSNLTSEIYGMSDVLEYIGKRTFNANGPAPDFRRNDDGIVTVVDPRLEAAKKKKPRTILIVSITVPAGAVFFFLTYVIYALHRRVSALNALAKKYQIEELEQLAGGPQSFKYKVLSAATNGFHSTHLLGTGGFGSVFKGKISGLPGAQSPTYVAIKRISATSQQGAREFLAEVKIIGQVQHRNLVRLLGWCHERGELLLVYDYMPNGNLDQHLFKCCKEDTTSSAAYGGEDVLSWARRLKIISGVATALAYLHEEWEQRVIHRDVKSSNVMLDTNFNARLGDFGLARLSDHAQAPPSTAVLAGTRGYLAPELGRTLKATEKTDVYSFGVMVLEVATGRRPLLPLKDRRTPDEILLVDLVWGLYKDGNILEVADCRLEGAFDRGEMVTLLKIGLLCCHPDPDKRPTMRQVMNIWKGDSVFPPLPRSKPIPVFLHFDIVEPDAENILMMPMKGYAESTSDRELDYTQARGLFSGPGQSVRSRPWKSTPLPM